MYIVYAVYSTYKCSRLCVIKLKKCIKVEIILGLEKKKKKNPSHSLPFLAQGSILSSALKYFSSEDQTKSL